MLGMTSPKVRHLLNNLCNFNGCRYLEIGLWTGSTLIPAIYENSLKYWGLDNWSEFRGGEDPRVYFIHNFKVFFGEEAVPNILDRDFKTVDFEKEGISKVNIFFYDGGHTEDDQYQALVHCYPALDAEFVFVVDDWNEEPVRRGTDRAIKDLGLHAIYHQVLPATRKQDLDLWWNGVGVYVFKKSPAAQAVVA